MKKIDRIKDKNISRDSIGVNIVGFTLTMMAGWLDTIGVTLFLKQRSASMTGRAHRLGYWAYRLEFKIFMALALIVIAFVTGACLSTLVAKRRGLMGSLTLAGALLIVASLPLIIKHDIFCLIFLPMALGSQNAGTSLTKIKRTTHLTGGSTDMAISIARREWKEVRFWLYRWIGFPLGSFIGFHLADMVESGIINISLTLLIPATVIILTGILQKKFLDIPLLIE